ncbi:MAG: tRNA (adenosine(37)-N6)-dimethylallyltransferase MiaA [Puniceicoccales bacterium]|jgi:tRNA dimethylallyltransferase|nr:tRNA (adenosine(37)-N6)-dimethylallyltransferase MiaA [Puniceicoccales bacterium]
MTAIEKKLWLITGCTAVGKTDYALEFARENNGEIISCDSLLVYRHMNIGTAKPTPEEMKGIRHHCIDLIEPWENFDVAMFIAAAKEAADSIIERGKTAIVAGGSGFYLKSFYCPVVDEIKIPRNVESFVAEKYATAGLDGLLSMLISLNDGICPCIDVKNSRRVAAALKRCLASGKTFDKVMDDFRASSCPFADYQKHTILLERSREDLETRVRARTREMLARGLVGEVKFLLENYDNLNSSVRNAIGYRETIRWLQHPTSEKDLAEEISRNTMKLVKKQKTWLKKQIPMDEKFQLQ